MNTIRRIVLVDDNDDDNVYHSRVVKKTSFDGELLVFDDGRSFLSFLEDADLSIPSLVFLDINMPTMNGFAVAREASPRVSCAPTFLIVMLTSSAASEDRARTEELPLIRGYLSKPLTVENVSAILREPPDTR